LVLRSNHSDINTRLQFRIILLVCMLVAGSWPPVSFAQDAAPDAAAAEGYKLGPRDQIKVSVFNQADLTGDYVLDGEGRFSMPLIGTVSAAGLTPQELATRIVDRLKPDFLVNPRVSVEVSNYRPYFLIGEVKSTGSFPYVEGITYLTAIAMAGGYSYRAKKDIVYVTRAGAEESEELKLDVNDKVQPGDIIRVAERFF
jgi:polysaccharide export outer membrane protein